MKRISLQSLLLALVVTFAIPILGYFTLGALAASIFAVGFIGGLVVWLVVPGRAAWASVRVPYLVALGLLIIHRGIEEQFFGFFPALAEISGVPYSEEISVPVAVLLLLSLMWVLSPWLIKWGYTFGHYGAWSFFFVVGVSELAHFVFPLLTPEPYGYFPGMVSAIFLVPAGWWGMLRLYRQASIE